MMKEQMIISQRNELEKEIIHYIELFYGDFESKDHNYLDKALQKYDDYKTYGGYRPFTYFVDRVLLKYKGGKV